MVLQTAQSREGVGYADSKSKPYTPKPKRSEMKAPGVYTSRENDPFYREREKIAQLERMLRNGTASEADIEHLANLRYMLYQGPFGC